MNKKQILQTVALSMMHLFIFAAITYMYLPPGINSVRDVSNQLGNYETTYGDFVLCADVDENFNRLSINQILPIPILNGKFDVSKCNYNTLIWNVDQNLDYYCLYSDNKLECYRG